MISLDDDDDSCSADEGNMSVTALQQRQYSSAACQQQQAQPFMPSLDVVVEQDVTCESAFQNIKLFWVGASSVVLVLSCCITFLLFQRRGRKRRRRKKIPFPSSSLAASASMGSAALERKRDFLSRSGDAYGYASCPSGHIDLWRQTELPNLIPPLGTPLHDDSIMHDVSELEVYLDYAGAALPTKTQLDKIIQSFRNSNGSILANPHSTGPAASRTMRLMEQAKSRVMDHFDCHPGRLAAASNLKNQQHPLTTTSTSSCEEAVVAAARLLDYHPGYDIVWTSGATEALRIVSEYFPWSTCQQCGHRSTLVYSHNSHTSVVGMRGQALAKGASFQCHSLSDICNANSDTIQGWCNTADKDCKYCRGRDASAVRNLLVFPLQCNFGGDRANAVSCIQNYRKLTMEGVQRWYTMLDLAKAASTDAINLKRLDPDFACISFYKLFGEPTGLGVLFVKRTAMNIFTNKTNDYSLHHYFGGGAVDAVLPKVDFAVRRSNPSPLASLSNGSVHFRGIASLCHGFDELDQRGGMELIRRHTATLAAELVRRLKSLKHANGQPAIVLYCDWANATLTNDNVDAESASLPGPTITFNVLRDDGTFVGYNEVSKLASLSSPPLQLRAGCFCNPGACQEALGLSDDEVKSNYLTSNHVCGDHIDIIDDKPTGAIRASFGKDSIWEDLDALVMFLSRNFVNESTRSVVAQASPVVSQVCLSELYIFPIKSCSAQRVRRWMLHADSGRLAFDREFALVDSSGTAMRLQTYPQMSLLEPSIDLEQMTMTVRAPGCDDLVLMLNEKCSATPTVQDGVIKVCGNTCGGKVWGDLAASEWFSSFLGVRCWLARHCGDVGYEAVSSAPLSSLRSEGVAFANEAPLLLLSQHSVDILNKVLLSQGQARVCSRHFRPNLVVRSTATATADSDLENATNGPETRGGPCSNPEDEWEKLVGIGKDLELSVIGQCARCSMVDVDPATGAKQKTLRALADYRRRNGQITFGVFLQTTSSTQDRVTAWLEEGDTFQCT